jgi:hypothetical protein
MYSDLSSDVGDDSDDRHQYATLDSGAGLCGEMGLYVPGVEIAEKPRKHKSSEIEASRSIQDHKEARLLERYRTALSQRTRCLRKEISG